MDREQWQKIGDKILDFANIGAGALIFGNAVGDKPFSYKFFITGLIFWLTLAFVYVKISRKES